MILKTFVDHRIDQPDSRNVRRGQSSFSFYPEFLVLNFGSPSCVGPYDYFRRRTIELWCSLGFWIKSLRIPDIALGIRICHHLHVFNFMCTGAFPLFYSFRNNTRCRLFVLDNTQSRPFLIIQTRRAVVAGSNIGLPRSFFARVKKRMTDDALDLIICTPTVLFEKWMTRSI